MLVFLLIGGMFVLFVRGDRHFFSLFSFLAGMGWYGLGWYRVRVGTPQEDICFSLVWSGPWGWEGGEGGKGVFLGGMQWGTGKFRFF